MISKKIQEYQGKFSRKLEKTQRGDQGKISKNFEKTQRGDQGKFFF